MDQQDNISLTSGALRVPLDSNQLHRNHDMRSESSNADLPFVIMTNQPKVKLTAETLVSLLVLVRTEIKASCFIELLNLS